MKFGAEIAVNGVRPKWLADDATVMWSPGGDTWMTAILAHWSQAEGGGADVSRIRLPEDHWAYTAIKAGYEPWAGGDAAPDDVDLTQDVLTRAAGQMPGQNVLWSHVPSRLRVDPDYDIIGYKKRVDPVAAAEPTTQPGTDPTVALLTEIRDLLKPKEIGIAYGVNEFGRNIRRAADTLARGTFSFAPYTDQPEPEPLTITITGPQGSGKTRWAEVIRNLPAALLGFPVPVVVDGEVG